MQGQFSYQQLQGVLPFPSQCLPTADIKQTMLVPEFSEETCTCYCAVPQRSHPNTHTYNHEFALLLNKLHVKHTPSQSDT